jgi:type II secretory pathway pseudopilin PulG
VTPRQATRPAVRVPRLARGRTHADERGFTLIVAMLMLAVIGLAAAAIMRNATTGAQVATNNRLQTQASQYAQFALRLCENQLALAPASRSVTLLAAASPPAWSAARNWTTSGTGAAHTLSPADIGSAVQPRVAPQCLMEATSLPKVYTVTARGFSADFRADPVTGSPRSGSVVWLQATVVAESGPAATSPGATAGGLTVRQRVWQQLLTPPF